MTTVAWAPVLVGADGSAAAAAAVSAAWTLAGAAGVPCRIIHALPEAWELPVEPRVPGGLDPEELNRRAADYARRSLRDELTGTVPQEALRHLEIRIGRPAAVLTDAAREYHAGLVVVGGKHHSALGRWIVGSTAHALVRTLEVPVLVTRDLEVPFRRVLAAVDLSEAASPTVHAAEHMAGLFDAELGLIHTVAPPLAGLGIPGALFRLEATEHSREQLARYIWPLTTYPNVQTTLRYGVPHREIAMEAAAWAADLVVVGSHGKGWFDRVVVGSTTEHLLNALPASLLVVPVVTGRRTRRRHRRPGTSHLEVVS